MCVPFLTVNRGTSDNPSRIGWTETPGTYGVSYLTPHGVKLIQGINHDWYARRYQDPFPCAGGFPTPEEALRVTLAGMTKETK